ncbi:MAG TPA: hypothetical protein VEK08_00465 [Planctomycetota bacterium]|nr:hypothetical protein [Planctomycetota bacterium]
MSELRVVKQAEFQDWLNKAIAENATETVLIAETGATFTSSPYKGEPIPAPTMRKMIAKRIAPNVVELLPDTWSWSDTPQP